MNRFYLTAALLGAAMLTGSLAARSYAQESAPVDKQPKPAPQALWVANETGPNISIFAPANLSKKTGTVASAGLSANEGRMSALTFDSNKDLWLGVCNPSGNSGYLADLTPRELRSVIANGSANFGVVIQDPNKTGNPEYLSCPLGSAFDPLGNLWVEVGRTASEPLSTLLEYEKGRLTTGRLPPSAVIEMPTQSSEPVDLVFDAAGNLWQVADGTVFEFTAAQLAAGVPTAPNQTLAINDVSPGLSIPQSITFDTHGNLWVAFGLGGTAGNFGGLEEFTADTLAGAGTVSLAPAITINATTVVDRVNRLKSYDFESFNSPAALAFDSEGDLWVGNSLQPASVFGAGSLVEFAASQLTTSGSPVPERAILGNRRDTNLGSPHFMTFGPALP
jgi:hypothetical protein